MLPRGFSSIVTMKVLCIALLLIGWSSAQAKKLDEKELERHCSRRDIAYVKEQVAEFGNKTVVEAKEKPYGDSCLMNVVYWGQRDRYWGQETCKKNPEICAQETLELVEYLLGIGADVNDKFYDGNYTAIAVATQNRDIPLMKLLLENKADIEIADLWGETPIFHTIGINSWSTDGSSALSLLIDNGANINAKDMYGRTALQVATSANSLRGRDGPVMELLQAAEKKQSGLQRLPNVRVRVKEDEDNGKRKMITTPNNRLLMKKGANIDAKDKNGKTALRVAMCKKEFQWGFELQEHGASLKSEHKS